MFLQLACCGIVQSVFILIKQIVTLVSWRNCSGANIKVWDDEPLEAKFIPK